MAPSTPTLKKAEPPIAFTLRGIKPDTRLAVFDRTFHLHSQKLKECSAFFFKIMDSPDNVPTPTPGTGTGQFKYEWIMKVDKDGSWVLGSASDLKVSLTDRRLFTTPTIHDRI
jgi:hypothetical protein